MIRIGEPATTLDTPIEHLMACHRRIEDRLTSLERAACLLRESPDAAAHAIHAAIGFLDSNGVMHTADEELSLFPRLRPRLSETERAYVDSLEHQHREAELVYEELKAIVARLAQVSDEDAQALRELAGRLRGLYLKHIRSEDAILTALARRSLDPHDLTAIATEMKGRRRKV